MQYSTHLLRHLRFTIGQNIHNARTKRRITLRRLSRLSCISETRLDQFELGKNAIHLDELLKLACALNMEIRELF